MHLADEGLIPRLLVERPQRPLMAIPKLGFGGPLMADCPTKGCRWRSATVISARLGFYQGSFRISHQDNLCNPNFLRPMTF